MEFCLTKYLHTMIRVSDPDATVAFFKLIGLEEVRRFDVEAGRFTPLVRDVTFSLDEFHQDIDAYNKKLGEALYGN